MSPSPPNSSSWPGRWLPRIIGRSVKVEPDELVSLLWSAGYFFCLLTSYYILKPLRDELGTAGSVENLPWLFTATLAAMLALNPVFSLLVARLPRERFIPYVYRFFALNILAFYLLLQFGGDTVRIAIGRAFYVWTAVFSLFVVSVFWGLMADRFSAEQAKRLFGFIAMGGTLGAIIGAAITRFAVPRLDTLGIDPANLLLVSIVMLEAACRCVRQICRGPGRLDAASERRAGASPIGGSAWAGFARLIRSTYLLGIAAYLFTFALTNTYLYFARIDISGAVGARSAQRIEFFAGIDLLANMLTIFAQLFITSRMLTRLGIGITLGVLPLITMIGFGVLAMASGNLQAAWVALIISWLEALRRASDYALARPAREALFTVLRREEKYKAKSLIDTVAYRGGDQAGAWSFRYLMTTLAVPFAGLCLAIVPLAGLWLALGLTLGWRQKRLAAPTAAAPVAAAPVESATEQDK